MIGDDLKGKRVLITGASSGLGAHFASVMAEAGAVVGLAARRLDRLTANAAALGKNGIAIAMDVTDIASIQKGIGEFAEQSGGLPDILINNAGIADPSGVLAATPENTSAVMATNQTAAFTIAQYMSQSWVEAGQGGNIINIASITGMRAVGGAAAYAISKAAVIHMTKIMALELARHGIRVNAIAPGYFTTDMNKDFLNGPGGEALVKRIPMRRFGNLDDLNGALLLLASDAGRYMTGVVIPVDGGHLCSSL